MTRLAARILPDGHRLYLNDGPIELIVGAWGATEHVQAAYQSARNRAATILDELCAELPVLRRRACPGDPPLSGAVARRMQQAVAPFSDSMFITPMAAVAGAVAEEVLQAMQIAAMLARAYVNNGGDIAVHLAPGKTLVAGLVDRPDRPSLFGQAELRAGDGVGGIATSGWRGRSHSLGIADAVTVLAATAAQADAAATVIANAVDIPGHPAVQRTPCSEIDPNSDLQNIPVTRAVGFLTAGEVNWALRCGLECAERLIGRGLAREAALHLQEQSLSTGVSRGSVRMSHAGLWCTNRVAGPG